MKLSVLLASLLLAAAPSARGAAPTRAQTEAQALRLRRQLDIISRVIQEKGDRTLLETLPPASEAAVWSTWVPGGNVSLWDTRSAPQAPGSPEEIAAAKAAAAPWVKLRKETSTLEVQQALIADELQRYKETGVLSPPSPATVKSIKRLLGSPWGILPPSAEMPKLSLDLVELQKQLLPYAKTERRPPAGKPLAAVRPAAQTLPAPDIRSAAPAPAVAGNRPRFERDAGTGRPEIDPVPGLIVLLSSAEPRGRALAADELGNRGAQAAPAVPALRLELSDPDRQVRASAAQALGGIGTADPDVLADLQRSLRDPSEEVRLSARAALQRLELTVPARPFPAYIPR
jgi:hypothetical protein